MRKLSQRHHLLKSLSSRDNPDVEKLIDEICVRVKQNPEVQKKFKEYGVSLDKIDSVPISFCEIDVSAKTKDKKIYLNNKLLEEEDPVEAATPYVCHEAIHVLQQMTGQNIDKGDKTEIDYLDLPSEQEAFSVQLDYIEREEGEESMENYLKKLLDHHDIHGKERKEKERELKDDE